jgi:hypothetical protein
MSPPDPKTRISETGHSANAGRNEVKQTEFRPEIARFHEQPFEHPAGIDRMTHVSVSIPHQHEATLSLETALDAGLRAVRSRPVHLLELGCDGAESASLDLRAVLPLWLVPRCVRE